MIFVVAVLLFCLVVFSPNTVAERIPGRTYHRCEFSGAWWSGFSYEQDGDEFIRGVTTQNDVCLSGDDVRDMVDRSVAKHLLVCLPIKRRMFISDYKRSCKDQ